VPDGNPGTGGTGSLLLGAPGNNGAAANASPLQSVQQDVQQDVAKSRQVELQAEKDLQQDEVDFQTAFDDQLTGD
jgi:hypothetical protein